MDNTFWINYNGQKFDINYKIISSLSDSILMMKLSDPLLDEIDITTKDNDTQLSQKNSMVDFIYLLISVSLKKELEPYPINDQNFLWFYDIAAKLGISDVFDDITEHISQNDLLPHALYLLSSYQDYNVNIYSIVDFIAENLSILASPDCIKLPLISYRLIFDSPLADKDQNPELYLSILKKIFNFLDEPNHPLIRYIPFSIIPQEDIFQLLQHPSLNLNKLRDIIFNFYSLKSSSETQIISPIEGYPFSGLLRKFPIKTDCSIPYDDKHNMEALLSSDPDRYYCSKEQNGYIIITFINARVILSHYELKGWKFAKNGVCPSSWKIEGTNDLSFQSWNLVTTKHLLREEINEFHVNYGHKLFSLESNESYQSFKFTQLSTSNQKNKRLALSDFDLYGLYSEKS